jgi:hypothetical protein
MANLQQAIYIPKQWAQAQKFFNKYPTVNNCKNKLHI